MKCNDGDVKVNNVCPRCGTVDGDLSVMGVDGQPVKIECYDEHHDDQDDLEGLAAREAGVLAAEEYLAKCKRSYVRSVGLLVRDIGRVLVGGGK